MIPKPLKTVATRQARKAYRHYYGVICKRCDLEDFEQQIYEKFWRDGLWDSSDYGILWSAARYACGDLARKMIWGNRQKYKFEEISRDVVGYDTEFCKVFDSHYYEIVSLNHLITIFSPFHQAFVKSYIKDEMKLHEIGAMLDRTEGRMSQIKTEIINRLHKLYSKDISKP